jgi:hypothetical protein
MRQRKMIAEDAAGRQMTILPVCGGNPDNLL